MAIVHNVSVVSTTSGGFVVWYGRGRVCRIVPVGDEGLYEVRFYNNTRLVETHPATALAYCLEGAIAYQWPAN